MKKMKHLFKTALFTLIAITFFTHCSDDDNEIVKPKTEEKEAENQQEAIDEQTLVINNFIHDNMEYYYFWNNEMPNIDPDQEEDSEEYFYKLINEPLDRWSFITDDYPALVKYFSGIEKSTGYSLQLTFLDSDNYQIVGIIEYIYPGTPAEEAGLKRGDIIYRIDGQTLNIDNYSELLSRTIFDITLAEFKKGIITEVTPDISVTAEEISLNPIVKTNIIDTLGHKIGYLAYTSFVYDYNQELEAAIGKFKEAGVTDMVLDLRYNGGGAVNSAELLGNMLVPPGNAGKTFIKSVYNNDVTNDIKRDPDYTPDFFLRKFSENENNLNISKLYVFTTASTASASEMIIYGLEPYMDVIQIGTQTHGKYYASITISDEDKHDWAMQPIILRSINALDNIDYTQGLIPDYELNDYFYNYPGELGEPKELFMAKAISLITGEPFIYESQTSEVKSAGRQQKKAEELRKRLNPLRYEMWVDDLHPKQY